MQRRVAVLVASQRVGTRLDAAGDVGGKRHAAEHPPVPVIAVGGFGQPPELVTGGRVGPEPQEFAYDLRVRVAPRVMERGGPGAVSRVEIHAEFDQRGDHRRVGCVQRGAVQRSRAEVVAGVRVGSRAKASGNLLGGGRLEEVPTAPIVAGLGGRG